MQRLAASDPSNSEEQRDLSISYERIGDTQNAQGDLAGTLKNYQAALTIRQRLAASNPSNSEWQTDVAMSDWKIGSLSGSPQSRVERRAFLEQGLKILDKSIQQQQLVPTQAEWPAKSEGHCRAAIDPRVRNAKTQYEQGAAREHLPEAA